MRVTKKATVFDESCLGRKVAGSCWQGVRRIATIFVKERHRYLRPGAALHCDALLHNMYPMPDNILEPDLFLNSFSLKLSLLLTTHF
jgi:hypothetical protein